MDIEQVCTLVATNWKCKAWFVVIWLIRVVRKHYRCTHWWSFVQRLPVVRFPRAPWWCLSNHSPRSLVCHSSLTYWSNWNNRCWDVWFVDWFLSTDLQVLRSCRWIELTSRLLVRRSEADQRGWAMLSSRRSIRENSRVSFVIEPAIHSERIDREKTEHTIFTLDLPRRDLWMKDVDPVLRRRAEQTVEESHWFERLLDLWWTRCMFWRFAYSLGFVRHPETIEPNELRCLSVLPRCCPLLDLNEDDRWQSVCREGTRVISTRDPDRPNPIEYARARVERILLDGHDRNAAAWCPEGKQRMSRKQLAGKNRLPWCEELLPVLYWMNFH